MHGDLVTWPLSTSPGEMLERVQGRAATLRRRSRMLAMGVPVPLLAAIVLAVGGVEAPDEASDELRTVRPAASETTTTTVRGGSVGGPAGAAAGALVEAGRDRAADTTGSLPTLPLPTTTTTTASEPSARSSVGRVAFMRDNRIWIVNADGSGLHAITDGSDRFGSLHWSPDGRRLAATWVSGSNRRIAVVELGGQVRFLTEVADGAAGPRWSPDGSRIAFGMYRDATGPTAVQAVWVMDADGTDRRLVTPAGFDPDWSPDGTKLAYWCGDGTCTIDADGRNQRVVSTVHHGARWSPDGKRLLATRWNGNSRAYQVLVTMTPQGLDEQVVVDTYATAGEWSPDGRSIVFVRLTTSPYSFNLWMVGPDGTGLRQLTSGADDQLPSFGTR